MIKVTYAWKAYDVSAQHPLVGKEELREILLNKSPSIPLFQRGRWAITIRKEHFDF